MDIWFIHVSASTPVFMEDCFTGFLIKSKLKAGGLLAKRSYFGTES